MPVIYRPCYTTREQVRRAVDIKQSAYENDRVDRAVQAASDSVDGFCRRRFYPVNATRSFDWPNYQYAYPWRLWLDQWELAAPPTLLVSGSLLPVPVVIPSTNYICHPINSGPPFTSIELRRDLNSAFGNNPTPQLDIAITGTFGYWTQTRAAGTLVPSINATVTTFQVSDSVSAGVGDVLICGSERMIITDQNYVDTTIGFAGLSTASASDNIVTVPDGTQFVNGEVLMADSEWIMVQMIAGNNLIVKRGFDGSVLAEHSGGTLYARRSLTVLRGALGTTGSAATAGSALAVSEIPGLVRELTIAEALVLLSQEPTAYGGSSAPQKVTSVNRGGFGVGESVPGAGLPDIRAQLLNSTLVRKARSRVI
jgi:hypothetical protein